MSEIQAITIVLDLPPRLLSPNAQRGGHWRHKRDAIKKYRSYTCMMARLKALAKCPDSIPWNKAKALAAFYWPDRTHRRDELNALASLKSAFDGFVDAGLIVDDDSEHLTHGPTTFQVDANYPRVEITIKRMA